MYLDGAEDIITQVTSINGATQQFTSSDGDGPYWLLLLLAALSLPLSPKIF